MTRLLSTLKLAALAVLVALTAACSDDDGVQQVCGDDAITGTEQCDDTQLGGNTCRSIVGGFTGGTLACSPTCTFDTTLCTTGAEVCGNAVRETGEDCDATDVGTATCESVGAFLGGTLACTGTCTFDTSGCEAAPSCGDDVKNGSEDCDAADVGTATCESVGAYVGGTLGCLGDCTYDVSLCETETDCGNSTIEAPEQCDLANLNGATCLTIAGGYVGGDLACAGDCTFDVSGCIAPVCGDDAINQGSESCDGTDLGGEDCETVGSFTGGVLACTEGCAFDTTGCIAPPNCGNGLIDTPEACDGTDLAGASCLTIPGGYVSGVLACAGDCTFDDAGCVLPFCGDGDLNQGSEVCDGSDLDGQDCTTVSGGFLSGTLTCAVGCTFDTAGCLTAAGEIAAVRQATSVPPAGLPLHAVYVTYVKRAVGTELAGFFVQATPEGPALYVDVPPASLSPVPAVGDLLALTVRAVATVDGQKRASAVDTIQVQSAGNDLSFLAQEVSVASDLVSSLDSYESELISVDVELLGALAFAGTGHVAATIATVGLPADPDLRLRVAADTASTLELESGCLLTVTETPLWRYNAVAQVSAWNVGEISNLVCPAPRVLSAVSTGDATVVITFSRNLDPASVTADGSQVIFDVLGFDALGAVAVGNTLVVTTEPQTPGQTYVVVVEGTVTDLLGAGVDPLHDTATFTTPSANVCLPPMVISQVYGGGGNTGATWKQDFIEIHNRSGAAVDIQGWSVQYTSSAGTTPTAISQIPAGSAIIVPAGGYYLIQGAQGSSGGTADVPADLVPTTLLALSGTVGKVALVSSYTPATGACFTSTDLVDAVYYGNGSCNDGTETPTLSNTTSAVRGNDAGGFGPGCLYSTPVPNGVDFTTTSTITPRNLATPVMICECGQ